MTLQDGLIAFYPLDETSGTTLRSLVWTGIDGSYTGGPNVSPNSLGNGLAALLLNGTNQRVDLTQDPCFSPTGGFSISAWVRWAGSGNAYQFIACGPGGWAYPWALYLHNGKPAIDPFTVAVLE